MEREIISLIVFLFFCLIVICTLILYFLIFCIIIFCIIDFWIRTFFLINSLVAIWRDVFYKKSVKKVFRLNITWADEIRDKFDLIEFPWNLIIFLNASFKIEPQKPESQKPYDRLLKSLSLNFVNLFLLLACKHFAVLVGRNGEIRTHLKK